MWISDLSINLKIACLWDVLKVHLYVFSFWNRINKDFLQFISKCFINFFVNPSLPQAVSFCMFFRESYESLWAKSSSQSFFYPQESFGILIWLKFLPQFFCSHFWKDFCKIFLYIRKYVSGVLKHLVDKALDSQSRVLYIKLLSGSKVDSAFHPSDVDKMSTRNFWDLSDKK